MWECGILLPGAGIKPESPALEGGVLTAGSPGKSQEGQHLFLGNAMQDLWVYTEEPWQWEIPARITIHHQPSAW